MFLVWDNLEMVGPGSGVTAWLLPSWGTLNKLKNKTKPINGGLFPPSLWEICLLHKTPVLRIHLFLLYYTCWTGCSQHVFQRCPHASNALGKCSAMQQPFPNTETLSLASLQLGLINQILHGHLHPQRFTQTARLLVCHLEAP